MTMKDDLNTLLADNVAIKTALAALQTPVAATVDLKPALDAISSVGASVALVQADTTLLVAETKATVA